MAPKLYTLEISDEMPLVLINTRWFEIGGGVMKSNSISNSFNSINSKRFWHHNGTYFPRETAYRSFNKNSSSVVSDGHNDNLKLNFKTVKILYLTTLMYITG